MTEEQFQYLDDQQLARIVSGHCPDCGYRGFVLGPRGGNAMNIECGGCARRFNVILHPYMRGIPAAHRIQSQAQGGSDWT